MHDLARQRQERGSNPKLGRFAAGTGFVDKRHMLDI